ncbi:MAG: response regulator [Cyclobacteriaceae bacterium]|nr:response regulator [Cyclobacteriaceae bacterium]
MWNVLVVDDEIDICVLVTKYLQRRGARADYALSIKEGLFKTTVTPYDLYLIDLNLADGTGYELIEKLRSMQVSSKIIMISAHDAEAKKAIAKGADYFLPKPLSKKAIDEALHQVNFSSN